MTCRRCPTIGQAEPVASSGETVGVVVNPPLPPSPVNLYCSFVPPKAARGRGALLPYLAPQNLTMRSHYVKHYGRSWALLPKQSRVAKMGEQAMEETFFWQHAWAIATVAATSSSCFRQYGVAKRSIQYWGRASLTVSGVPKPFLVMFRVRKQRRSTIPQKALQWKMNPLRLQSNYYF